MRKAVAAGTIDERFLEAARVAARRVVGTRPTQTGAMSWSSEEIDDLVMDSVVRVTPEKIVLSAAAAANDLQFAAWLRTIMTTTLDRRARRTPTGRLMKAVDDALSEDRERFELKDGFWQLAADESESAWSDNLAPLVDAAWRVETVAIRFTSSPTAPLLAQRRDIRAVAEAVLAISGPLRKVDLTEVLASRFNVPLDLGETSIESHDGTEVVAADADVGFEDLDDDLAASWLESQLTVEDREVLVLRLKGRTLRDLMQDLDCTKHRAEVLVKRVEATLASLASELPDGGRQATARLLQKLGPEADLGDSIGQDGH